MRPGAEFAMVHGGAMAPTAAPLANGTHSPWQSPVPYLFGGLAAMLGLIAFALLILACSYWKLSGYLDGDARAGAGGGEDDGEKGSAGGAARPAAALQEHVVVIMAGEARPTFLAMPSAGRAAVELGAMANPEAAASALGGGGGAPEPEKKTDESPQLVGGGYGSESSGATSTALQESSQ